MAPQETKTSTKALKTCNTLQKTSGDVKVKDNNMNVRENYTNNSGKKSGINIFLIVIISLLIISVLIYFLRKNNF